MPQVYVPPKASPGDPFARPAGDVTTEEWRILISAIAGRLRLSQGFSREIVVPVATPILLAENSKSYALFVSGRALAVGFGLALGGDPRSANAQNGLILSDGSFEQVLLPKEKLYGFALAGGTLVVTQVTV